MSPMHPFVLYVGGAGSGRRLLDTALARGAWAYLAQDATEALGAYVAYTPDAVVLDAAALPACAAEAYYHLRSVEARPLFILTSDRAWDVSVTEADAVYLLDPDTAPDDLLDFVKAALEPILLPSAFAY